MDDRIILAEAMGWELMTIHNNAFYKWTWYKPDGSATGVAMSSKDGGMSVLPDPFTDANDDYDVLEWFRGWAKTAFRFKVFAEELYQLNGASIIGYKIGNNARAALEVLEDE